MRKSTPLFTLLHHTHTHTHNLHLFLLKPFSSSLASPLPDLPSQIFTILTHPQWRKDPSFDTLIPSLTPTHLSSLFNLNPNPLTALNFFRWIKTQHGFPHNVSSYHPLLLLLVRHRLLRAAENVRNSMIKSCTSPHDARFVLNLLRRMNNATTEDERFKLSITSYNRLLMCLSRFVMVDELNSLYKEMLNDGVYPNLVTFNTMLNAHCKLGNVVAAKLYLTSWAARRGS